MDVHITYRKTSRLSLRIGKYGEVRVSAPYGYPKEKIEEFVNEQREWISGAQKRKMERLEKRNEFFDKLPLTTRQECQDATNRMNAIIPPLVEKYAKLMKVCPKRITYKATISKWGSCNKRTGCVQFSAYLLLLPDWCIEHTVVHELAHLIEANHGPRFYALMDQYFPKWREARAETRRISRLEDDDE